MRSPWKLLAALEALALLAVFVLWPRGDGEPAAVPEASEEASHADAAAAAQEALQALTQQPEAGAPAQIERETVDSSGAATEIDALGVVLAGRILDSDGQAVPEAGIWFDVEGQRVGDARSDAFGGFAVSGLRPGPVEWGIRAEGFARVSGTIDVPASPQMQRRDFILGKATVVNVRLETETGDEFFAWLFEQDLNWRLPEAVTVVATETTPTSFEPVLQRVVRTPLATFRSRGSFGGPQDLPTRYSGILSVNGPAPVVATALLRNEILASAVLEPGMDELVILVRTDEFVEKLCRVTTRILDASTGAPIPEARAELSDSQSGGPGVLAEADGTVTFEFVRPGILELGATAPEYGSFYRWVRLRAGDQVDLGDIRLTRALILTGQLVQPDGTSPGTVTIGYRNLDDEAFLQEPPRRSGRTDADGKFEMHGIPRGRIVIVAESDTVARQTFLVDTRGGALEPLELRLRPGAVVSFEFHGTDHPEAFHWVFDDAGNPVGRSVRAHRPTLALAGGRYRLESVLPSGQALKSTSFSVDESPTTVRVELP